MPCLPSGPPESRRYPQRQAALVRALQLDKRFVSRVELNEHNSGLTFRQPLLRRRRFNAQVDLICQAFCKGAGDYPDDRAEGLYCTWDFLNGCHQIRFVKNLADLPVPSMVQLFRSVPGVRFVLPPRFEPKELDLQVAGSSIRLVETLLRAYLAGTGASDFALLR